MIVKLCTAGSCNAIAGFDVGSVALQLVHKHVSFASAISPRQNYGRQGACLICRDCVSDEHYPATMMAATGRENETDCEGFLTSVEWIPGHAHPHAYVADELTPQR